MSETHYDVIVVGGRCAGSSLAMHLASQSLRVMIVDRAEFPSLPSVPSSPIIYPHTMQALEELGLTEEDYTHPGSQIGEFILDVPSMYAAVMPSSLFTSKRKYAYGIDRRRLDNAIWEYLKKCYPGVIARDNFSVTDIQSADDGQVTGIVGKTPGGAEERFTADLVVGADGRFSFTARKFDAKVIEEHNDHITATYQAEWDNVEPHPQQSAGALTFYNTGRGLLLLCIPIAQRKYIIATYMRAQDAQIGDASVEEFYLNGLKSVPSLWKRLTNAQRVTDVVGMKRIENAYREASGPGWALIGDALHYKDPLDGQGIYDALVEAKILGEIVGQWKRGELKGWSDAGALYWQRVNEATHEMFLSTVARVKNEVHTIPPKFVLKTIVRWMLTDPEYQHNFLNYLARELPPSVIADGPNPRFILRGIGRDLKALVTRKSAAS